MISSRSLLLLLMLMAGLGLACYSFQLSLTPYVDFAQAMAATGPVQVLGTLNSEVEIMADQGILRFSLIDEEGVILPVLYRGSPPINLHHAQQIGAVGEYREGFFQAHKLLVKCPSKYQGE
ncbi:MAG: cytochrome c maturation protein CcmE [Limnochordia bacterium]|jgi:cytochrome c-type biogenesis protein CcmE